MIMNNCKIKIFEEDYRDQKLSLWQKCKLIKTLNDPNKDIDRKLKVKDDLFLVIEYNNLIIGSAMAGYDGHRGYVYYLAIDPIHQNKGLGKLLMDNIEKKLKEIGCPKINIFIRSSNINVKIFINLYFMMNRIVWLMAKDWYLMIKNLKSRVKLTQKPTQYWHYLESYNWIKVNRNKN